MRSQFPNDQPEGIDLTGHDCEGGLMTTKRRPDDMTAEEFLTTPTEDLEHGLRCVIYEMLVLALALVQLRNKGEIFTGLPFGEEQTADTAALLRSRVLLEFFFPEKNSMPNDLKVYFESANKWTTHLTWQRVRKEDQFPQPFPDDILKHGMSVLDHADAFVEKCRQDHGYNLTSRNAPGYYAKFQELYSELRGTS